MKLVKIILLMLLPVIGFGQTLKVGSELTVVHFNAGWNSAADVKWVGDLTDCKLKRCDIATDTKSQDKFEIVVVPTIIIFYEGEELMGRVLQHEYDHLKGKLLLTSLKRKERKIASVFLFHF